MHLILVTNISLKDSHLIIIIDTLTRSQRVAKAKSRFDLEV